MSEGVQNGVSVVSFNAFIADQEYVLGNFFDAHIAASEIPVQALVRCITSPHEIQLKTSFFRIGCEQDLQFSSMELEEFVRFDFLCSKSRARLMISPPVQHFKV